MTRFSMTSQPEQAGVTHFIEMVEVQPTDEFARRIGDWLKDPMATRPQERCHICGAMFTIPDGNIKGHITRHLAELGGEDAHVHLLFRHRGPAPSTLPSGLEILTEEEIQELKATGKVGSPPD